MRVLFIGGTRFIGPYIVRQFVARGDHVVAYHRGECEAALPEGVEHVHSPLAGMPVLAFPDELLVTPPDVVIHMIAMGEEDAQAAVNAFHGHVERLVAVSSGDVYLAYGRLTGLDPGPPLAGLLDEDSPLRSAHYPYRGKAESPADWLYSYEKILVERTIRAGFGASSTVLRLPKVYGPGGNADLATVYQFRHQPGWRWTHGYVENVAAAVVLAATHPAAGGRIYNVGEEDTPTVAGRLDGLPISTLLTDDSTGFDFSQDIAYDTSRIRSELGYAEPVSYEEGLRRTLRSAPV